MLIGTLTCDAKKGSDGDGNLSLLRHVELPANCLTLSHLCGLGCMKEESIDGVAGIGCGIYICMRMYWYYYCKDARLGMFSSSLCCFFQLKW